MDLRKLKTLIDLVSESGVAELEITEGEDHVRIVNRPTVSAAPVVQAPAAVTVAAVPQAAPAPAAAPAAAPAPPPVGSTGSRSGCCSGRPANHHEPDGGHFLPCAVARRSAFH